MPNKLKSVTDMLAQDGLREPELDALIPNQNTYDVLLMQPLGNIEGDAMGVRNHDSGAAEKQFGQFLADACHTKADLVITPEYSMPWKTLTKSIENGAIPEKGKLWVLGCESIKYSELMQLQQDLAPHAAVRFEPLQPKADRFLDPLAYVFLATSTDGVQTPRLVVLVQFKTCPMSDPDHFERDHLQCGTHIYRFGGSANPISLVSVICSDALEFTDALAAEVNDRTLIIHIQLNSNPRHHVFRQYRDRLFRTAGDSTEIICLNWARNIQLATGASTQRWSNIGGSAWYLRSETFDLKDQTLVNNHRRGLYYTWIKPHRVHALFFNYEPATYLVRASKVVHLNVVVVHAQRTGPSLVRTRVWDPAADTWVDQNVAQDGFAGEASFGGANANALIQMTQMNPFVTERMLALSVGDIVYSTEWHGVKSLDSFTIDTTEVVKRMTFCQDPDWRVSRVTRLRRYGFLWNHLQNPATLPPALKALGRGFELTWSEASPHQNLISMDGERATVIYLGEDREPMQVEEIANRVSELLARSLSVADDRITAKQRLFVWFRNETGAITLHDRHPHVTIDKMGDESAVDFGRDR